MEIKQALEQLQKRPETFEDIRKDAEARFRELVEAWMQRRSTFQTTLGAMQAFNNVFDRLDAALKRELPQRDPDWAEICTKCHDGESPEDCEYFGEPNGCNSPIYGQHPNTKPCGNSAALREALKRIVAASIVAKNANAPEWILQRMADIFAMATTALSAPPRNCDIAQDWLHDLYVKFKPPASVKREMPPEWADAVMAFCRWLVATAQEGCAK